MAADHVVLQIKYLCACCMPRCSNAHLLLSAAKYQQGTVRYFRWERTKLPGEYYLQLVFDQCRNSSLCMKESNKDYRFFRNLIIWVLLFCFRCGGKPKHSQCIAIASSAHTFVSVAAYIILRSRLTGVFRRICKDNKSYLTSSYRVSGLCK